MTHRRCDWINQQDRRRITGPVDGEPSLDLRHCGQAGPAIPSHPPGSSQRVTDDAKSHPWRCIDGRIPSQICRKAEANLQGMRGWLAMVRRGGRGIAPEPPIKKPRQRRGERLIRSGEAQGPCPDRLGVAAAPQFTGVTLATRPPWRWICCWASSILSKVTKRTVLLRLCRR